MPKLVILTHSSKSMTDSTETPPQTTPVFIEDAQILMKHLKKMSVTQLQKHMKISSTLAGDVKKTIAEWGSGPGGSAIEMFRGDIYSGIQAETMTRAQQAYTQDHLVILSGLYGALRPYDRIEPYRFEMGYKSPDSSGSMYIHWGSRIAEHLEPSTVINTSSVEYTKAVLPNLATGTRVITPKFLTVSDKTGKPTFVTVHTKIARGAYARWAIDEQVDSDSDFTKFNRLGYKYDASQSTADEPVFVCQEFKGVGLSVRQTA